VNKEQMNMDVENNLKQRSKLLSKLIIADYFVFGKTLEQLSVKYGYKKKFISTIIYMK
jgi:hypothetical protein